MFPGDILAPDYAHQMLKALPYRTRLSGDVLYSLVNRYATWEGVYGNVLCLY